jgi:hypothetical protein
MSQDSQFDKKKEKSFDVRDQDETSSYSSRKGKGNTKVAAYLL